MDGTSVKLTMDGAALIEGLAVLLPSAGIGDSVPLIVEGALLTVGVSVKFDSEGASLAVGASLRDGGSVALTRLGAMLTDGRRLILGAGLRVGTREELPDEGALLVDGDTVLFKFEGASLIDGASVPLLVAGEMLKDGAKEALSTVGARVVVGPMEGVCDVADGLAEPEGLPEVIEGVGARESTGSGDLLGRNGVGCRVGRGDGTAIMGRDVIANTVGLGLMFEGRICTVGRMPMEVGILVIGLIVCVGRTPNVVGFLEGLMPVGLITVGRIARAAKASAKYGRKKTVDCV